MVKNKIITYLIFLLIGFLQIACNKGYEYREISIEYEFTDDVSPVKTILWVKEDLHWSEWKTSDSSLYYPDNKNTIEHVFWEEGIFTVEIEASVLKSGIKYFGEIEIETPPIANKFIIYGFYFNESLQFEINEDSLKIEISYYDSNVYFDFDRLISKSTIENNDTVKFEEPIVIDITGFSKTEYNLSCKIYFLIKTQSGSSIYFQDMFYLREKYFQNRVDTSPVFLYLSNDLEESNEKITILVDWTYY